MSRRSKPSARPAPHVGHWGFAVIRATPNLGDGAKLVIQLLLELDRPSRDGCGGAFQEPGRLAEQLGMTVTLYKYHRAECQRAGILEGVSVPGSKLAFWFPRLPDGFDLAPPADATQDVRRAWVQRSAGRLARHIDARREGQPACPDSEKEGQDSAPRRTAHLSSSEEEGQDSPPPQDSRTVLTVRKEGVCDTPSVTLKEYHMECHTAECDMRSVGAEAECDTKSVSGKPGNLAPELAALIHKLESEPPTKAAA